jgi:hypothetical protein
MKIQTLILAVITLHSIGLKILGNDERSTAFIKIVEKGRYT